MSVVSYGLAFLTSPAKAAEESRKEDAFKKGLVVYVAALAGAALYYSLKPFDFPDPNAPVPLRHEGLLFWLKVMLWQPLLMAALVGFTGAMLRWFKDGWLPLKVASSFFWTAVPLILCVFYVKNQLPKAAFGALMLAWAAPGVWVGRGVEKGEWRVLAAFLLGLNAIELASLVPEAFVTVIRSETGYKAVVGVAGLWMLVGGALGLKRLPPERPLPRALLPLLFALVLQICVVVAAYLLGWLPAETLKALLYG